MGAEGVYRRERSEGPGDGLGDSHVRRKQSGTIPTAGHASTIAVVTVDTAFCGTLLRRLGTRGEVRRVDSMLGLLSVLDSSGGRAMLVVDCALPSIAPTSIAAMAHLLPEGTDVLLWGVTPGQRGRFFRNYPTTVGWRSCSPDASTDELVDIILS